VFGVIIAARDTGSCYFTQRAEITVELEAGHPGGRPVVTVNADEVAVAGHADPYRVDHDGMS
jgi:hypothetical protein